MGSVLATDLCEKSPTGKVNRVGLGPTPLFWFRYICTFVYFKTLKTKTSIDRDMNCEKLSSCF